MRKKFPVFVAAVMLACAIAGASSAAVYHPAVPVVTASSEFGTASWGLSPDGWTYKEIVILGKVHKIWEYRTGSPIEFWSGYDTGGNPRLIGTLFQLVATIDEDPMVGLVFMAGAGAADTVFSFSIDTPVPLASYEGYASAQIGGTDFGLNGLSISGAYAGGATFQARYNTPAVVFAEEAGPVIAVPGGSGSNPAWGRYPAAGWASIAAPVDKVGAEFNFTLSANDWATGSGVFEIRVVPEPGGAVAIVCGLVSMVGVVLRRRAS